MKLIGKLIITGHLEALTGLAIGGSKTDVVIGGIDNNVIKNAEGVPYIPGSSLKGKLRSLIEKREGRKKVCNCGESGCPICPVFGTGLSPENKDNDAGPTRLYVRDAMMNQDVKEQMENKEGLFSELELTYTEGKWENTINRLTSKASHPRQQERVPAGSLFDLNIIYNILTDEDIDRFKYVIGAFRLLEDDYIGGNGSRGYGRVKFNDLKITVKTISDYEEGNPGTDIYTGPLSDFNHERASEEISRILAKED
jgi:CRISPR-associated protein Csm3